MRNDTKAGKCVGGPPLVGIQPATVHQPTTVRDPMGSVEGWHLPVIERPRLRLFLREGATELWFCSTRIDGKYVCAIGWSMREAYFNLTKKVKP